MWWKVLALGAGLWLGWKLLILWVKRPPNIQRLTKAGDIAGLAKAMDFPDPAVRKKAVQGLGEINSEAVIDPLLRALRTRWVPLSSPAAATLGKVSRRLISAEARNRIAEALVAMLSGESYLKKGEVDREIEKALVELGAPAVEPLLRALGNARGLNYERSRAAGILARIGDARAIAPLLELAAQGDEYMRRVAANCLGAFPGEKTTDTLFALLSDANSEVRQDAIRTLGNSRNSQAYPRILEALADSNADIRAVACRALAEFGNREAVPLLLKKLTDPERSVRDVAAEALRRLGCARPPEDILRAEARLLKRDIAAQSNLGSEAWHFGAGPSGKPKPMDVKSAVLKVLQEKYQLDSAELERIIGDG